MKRLIVFLFSASIVLGFSSISSGAIEWDLEKSLKVGSTPRDLAVSPDGKYTYVLTDGGNVIIYSSEGAVVDKINLGDPVDGIEISKDGSKLFLTKQAEKSIEIINISFIHDINMVGSPFKGDVFAPVAIVVFSDFQ